MTPTPTPTPGRLPAPAAHPSLWDFLTDAQLIVACGAGGVGKTTVSAALGVALARTGRRVLVLTVDPARRLADALGHDLGPDPLRVHLPREPAGLDAAMLDPPTSFRRVVERLPASQADRARLLGSRITRELATGDAGMQELMAIVELQRFHGTGDYDAIVLDTPPALHALDLLDGPERIVGLLSGRTIKAISAATGVAGRMGRIPGPGRALSRLWGADLMSEIATFLDAAAPFGAALRGDLDRADALLQSPSAAFTVVTAPADAPLRVAAELRSELARRGHAVAGTIVNRRRAPLPAAIAPATLEALPGTLESLDLTRSVPLARHLAALTDHELTLLDEATLPTPLLHLGERPASESPAEVLSALASMIAGD